MQTVAPLVIVLVAAWVGFSAFSLLTRKAFIADNLESYGVPERWWSWLGAAKALGSAGLVVGLLVPWIGVAAAVGLVAYFTGATLVVLRARAYTHVAFPMLYLVPAAVAGWPVTAR